jgi:CBS domain-containing protein
MNHVLTQKTVAREIMSREPVCAELGMSIRAVARLFEENEISGAPVVDTQGRVVGVVSRTDLIRRYTEGDADYDPQYLIELFGGEEEDDGSGPMPERLITVDDFMTSDPITAHPTTPVQMLAAKMVQSRVHRVVIVDDQRFPVGIVTSLDLVKALAGV